MKTVTLYDDVESISLDELAELIAYARYPGDDERSKKLYRSTLEAASTEVHNDANDGSLTVVHPLTGMPLPPLAKHDDPLEALFQNRASPEPEHGLVFIEELCRYVALRGIAVEIETALPTTEAASDSVDEATKLNSPMDAPLPTRTLPPDDELSPAERDEKALKEREKWIGGGRKAKDWDEKHSMKIGKSISEVKRRMAAAAKRRGTIPPRRQRNPDVGATEAKMIISLTMSGFSYTYLEGRCNPHEC